LGTGINRPPSKDVKEIISLINNLKNTRVSIDVPSGLCEKNDYTCIKADITLTMMFPKKVFLNQFKAIQCGKIIWLNFKLNQKEKNGYHLPNTNENYIDISEYIKKKNETH
ncbi:MAG: NAD(P)H-hydrate epimerase, partial [Candidatus Margulisiibacteriota bacterium]